MKKLPKLTAFILLTVTAVIGQKNTCKVGSVDFRCPSPKYYPEIKVSDPLVRVFKYKDGDDKVYFFMADSAGRFDPTSLSKLIPGLAGTFEWKSEADPLVMELGTKYKFDLVALLGL